MTDNMPRHLPGGPDQGDVDALRSLLDLMKDFTDNDQRARYLLTCNWFVDEGAAASLRAGDAHQTFLATCKGMARRP